MDNKLINDFRDAVNEKHLIMRMYRNFDGRDQWGIICSAMDWITVAVDGISIKNIELDNTNTSSIRLMTFIMCIDVLWESIQQLHRVFFHTTKIPFNTDNSVFTKKYENVSDNQYFKTIRACFAAHPVNLNDYFTNVDEKENRYASWTIGGVFGTGDFTVLLYSNDPSKDTISLAISIEELLQFAEQRYQYLSIIIAEINKQKEQFCVEWRTHKITRVNSVIGQIDILIAEEQKRFGSDYYHYQLIELRRIFSTLILNKNNRAIVQEYQKALLPEIHEIFSNLQGMRFQDLENENDIRNFPSNQCQYAFSKLAEAVEGGCEEVISKNIIRQAIGKYVELDEVEDIMEMYVVAKAGFWKRKCVEETT